MYGSTPGRLVAFAAVVAALLSIPTAAAAEGCPNAVFRNGPSAHLPDCRAYEMVSPSFKDAGLLDQSSEINFVSPDGSSLLQGVGLASFSGQESDPGLESAYSMVRTETGWTTQGEDLPGSEYATYLGVNGVQSFSAVGLDARTTAWLARGPGGAENAIDIYRREPDRSIVHVGPTLPPTAPPAEGTQYLLGREAGLYLVGLSADASHTIFKLDRFHWSFDHTEESLPSLYEYAGAGNTTPTLVGLDNAGNQISQCGTELGGGAGTKYHEDAEVLNTHNAVSADGKTVFFTAYPPGYEDDGCTGTGPPVAELYARVEGGRPGAHTVSISEPSKQDCSECDTEAGVLADAHFVGASADSSKVFFTTAQPLLGGDATENLYEYDSSAPAGQRIVRVSGGDATTPVSAAGVRVTPNGEGMGISEDGSHAYFLASGVLTNTPNRYGLSAQPGARNLYLFERDAQYPDGRTVFIATLGEKESEEGPGRFGEITPDGRYLVFTSRAELTPDDTSTAQQVFEYDAQTGALVRVSVGRGGFNDNGNTNIADARILTPEYGRGTAAYSIGEAASLGGFASHRSISANGEYVFFESSDALTPEALDNAVLPSAVPNKLEYAINIYEYHDGVVSLITDGRDVAAARNVKLLGTDESGRDVFFSTTDPLVAQDTDTNVDIYDARIDGGFPAPVPPASCAGEACQGQLSASPTLLSPGSEFQAGGNPPLAAQARATTKATKPRAAKKRKRKPAKHTKRGKRGKRASVRRRSRR